MRTSRGAFAGALLSLAFAVSPLPAEAATSFDFLFDSQKVSNDTELFLHLAVRDSKFDRGEVEPVLPRLRKLEADLPIVLYLSRHSGRPPKHIADLRAGGVGWAAMFVQLGVSYDLLFIGIDRDPGPPYGKAWGYWKKHPKQLRLSDDEIRGLVEIQIGHRWAGLTPYKLAREKGRGKTVAILVAEKKGRPYHGQGTKGAGQPQGKDGKGKGEKVKKKKN